MRTTWKAAMAAAGVLLGGTASAQTPVWDYLFSLTGNVGGNYETPFASAVDANGNLVTVGTTGRRPDLGSPVTANSDWAVMKRRADGTLAWNWRTNGPGNGLDIAYDVAIDGSGNVYVAGTVYRPGSGLDARVVSYNPDGVLRWERIYASAGVGFDGYRSIAIDSAGDLVLAGTTVDGSVGQRWLIEKRRANDGSFVWGRTFGAAGGAGQTAVDVGTDAARNVVVFGNTVTGSGQPLKLGTASWSSTGAFRWSRVIGSSDAGAAEATRLHVSQSGTVTVAGTIAGQGLNGADFAAARYSQTGSPLWTRIYNSGLNRADIVNDLAVDGFGTAYVVGSNRLAGFTLSDFQVVALRSSDGAPKYVARFDGGSNLDDEALACRVDESGYLTVAGRAGTQAGFSPRSTLGVRWLDPNGELLASASYGNASLQTFGMQVVGLGDRLYVTGAVDSAQSGMDWAQLRFRLNPALAGLIVSPSPLISGATGTVRVNLNLPAPAGGTRVRFEENSSLVNGIPDLVIAEGRQSGVVAFGVAGASSSQSVRVEALLGQQRLVQTVAISPGLASLTSATTSIPGGNSFLATVALAGPAPSGGTVVRLQSLNPFLTVPASVRVAAGQTSVSFLVAAGGVSSNSAGTYRALLGSTVIPRNVTVRLPSLTALEAPASIRGGQELTATVRLDGVSSVARTLVVTDNSASVNAPPTATIPAGARSATIRIPTTAVSSSQTVELTVRLGTQTLRRNFTLNP